MNPKITGICMYPLAEVVATGGTVPSKHDIATYRCSKSCEVPFTNLVDYNLICAGEPGGDFYHVSVEGVITKNTGDHTDPEPLSRLALDMGKKGADGSYRVHWTWPNRESFKEIKAIYKIQLSLIKRGDTFESILWKEEQEPFFVKLLPPPPPKPVKPS
jgi:hypothetical protein